MQTDVPSIVSGNRHPQVLIMVMQQLTNVCPKLKLQLVALFLAIAGVLIGAQRSLCLF
ncbi:hypothetical protein ACOSYY_18500 [Nitrospira sp. BLG_2]